MRMHDSSLLYFIQKFRSLISWSDSDSNSIFSGFKTMDKICSSCSKNIIKSDLKYQCQSCGNLLCDNCIKGLASSYGFEPTTHSKESIEAVIYIKSCKLCYENSPLSKSDRRCSGKVYPSESPRQSPEPSSPSFSGERCGVNSPLGPSRSSDVSHLNHPSPLSVHRATSRSLEDEGEQSTSHIFSLPNEYLHDASGVDLGSFSARHEFYGVMSSGSSPSDSPSRLHITSSRVGPFVQLEQGGNSMSQNDGPFNHDQTVLESPGKGIWGAGNSTDHPSILQPESEKLPLPLDFETNSLIWLPPPPDNVDDDVESNLFTYDDEDEEVGDSGAIFLPTANIDSDLAKEKQNRNNKEPWRSVVERHFRALVSQLLQGQGIIVQQDSGAEDWLDIVTAIAWQAAKFLKPDTSRGGSMDPSDYLKVKCVASGSPCKSKLIKGVACTKNIKHKRMMSQYKNAKLLLLGGALEYQRVPNQLASFESLLQQENDHLRTVVSKIEARHPNVLLVEKSVSSFALEHLLEKEISLVLNVKRPLLEKIARCTGASITPSTDHISTTRLGHCELFHLERISEDHEPVNQFNKKPSKTLMFFEGCPRRLGCTVVLRGSHREELKKVKHVVQYAVFAAYHLLLETSFLADEGASLPKVAANPSHSILEKMALDQAISTVPGSFVTTSYTEDIKASHIDLGSADLSLELGLQESLSELGETGYDDDSIPDEFRYRRALSEACNENLALDVYLDPTCPIIRNHTLTESICQEEGQSGEVGLANQGSKVEDAEGPSEYFSANENHQSILVSFSSHCMVNRTVCERSRLLRLKFYGHSDKPLGRFLRDDLFDQSYQCRSCKESAEAHVICYTHQNANLTINVKRLPSVKLPGQQDGKIWMWHRCLRCKRTEGVPPATQRVIMSDSAWGLSFGKFLELSFLNHATGNRVASCGHSLQRDCLRFYGFGNMVAFFRYSPINILSVRLPPSILEFGGPSEQSWMRNEAYQLLNKAKALHAKISGVLEEFKTICLSSVDEVSDASELHDHVLELNDILAEEKTYYEDLLQLSDNGIPDQDQAAVDIFEINRLRHTLLIGSQAWDRRLSLLDTLLKRGSSPKAPTNAAALSDCSLDFGQKDSMSDSIKFEECPNEAIPFDNRLSSSQLEPGFEETYRTLTWLHKEGESVQKDEENAPNITSLERVPSAASILSEKIDSAWSGADLALNDVPEIPGTLSFTQNKKDNPTFRRLTTPARVYSFDSAQRLQERIKKGLPPSSFYLSAIRSFHASGDYRYMVRDPVTSVQRTYSQVSPVEAEKLNLSSSVSLSFISSVSLLPEGARLMVLQNGPKDTVITVYENEPTSIISYALTSNEYQDWVTDRLNGRQGRSNIRPLNKVNSLASDLATWQSFSSLDLDHTNYGSYSSEDASSTVGSVSADQISSHFRFSFMDESSNASSGKAKFSITCYFAKQFDLLRRKCCPSEVDFVRSLSRCKRWSAQGGKSNAYFAKSYDDRLIIKQVTKTELDSFEEFAPEYFKYLTDALTSGSPTCLAKILGIFQVTVKHMKRGKEVKMELMVMENLFYNRSISKVYDLKGSARSRYNSDTTGANKVLLDMNLLETLRTNPIFLGGKAKRRLERAVWNDTSFLASVDVMDYSLLVGVDEERKELVMGIIDFMRQYTWDKHLETWVKASGILGGRNNASPTIISPKQYKKRFRKAMTTYFLTLPDQWPS